MIAAAFDMAERLFGLRFDERTDMSRSITRTCASGRSTRDGTHVGLFLGDYFARPAKRSGAWMTALRASSERLAGDVHARSSSTS